MTAISGTSRGQKKWNDGMYVRAYEAARSGLGRDDIAKACGVSEVTFLIWTRKRPYFKAAVDAGRAKAGALPATTENFREYIVGQLPEHLRPYWDELHECEQNGSAYSRCKAMFKEDRGNRMKKHLFLYAFVDSSFSVMRACRLVGLTKKTLHRWIRDDPQFAEIVDEINYHKKDFFEGALISLVQEGNPAAVIFANRTYNRDLGYGEKLDVNLGGTVEHKHVISVDELDLPLDVRKAILKAYQEKEEAIDVEYAKESNGKFNLIADS